MDGKLAKQSYNLERVEKERKTPTACARAVIPKAKAADQKQSGGIGGLRASLAMKVKKTRFSLFGRKASKQIKEAVLADMVVEECSKKHLDVDLPDANDSPPIGHIRADGGRVAFSNDFDDDDDIGDR